jgi:hypothetical protein
MQWVLLGLHASAGFARGKCNVVRLGLGRTDEWLCGHGGCIFPLASGSLTVHIKIIRANDGLLTARTPKRANFAHFSLECDASQHSGVLKLFLAQEYKSQPWGPRGKKRNPTVAASIVTFSGECK